MLDRRANIRQSRSDVKTRNVRGRCEKTTTSRRGGSRRIWVRGRAALVYLKPTKMSRRVFCRNLARHGFNFITVVVFSIAPPVLDSH